MSVKTQHLKVSFFKKHNKNLFINKVIETFLKI